MDFSIRKRNNKNQFLFIPLAMWQLKTVWLKNYKKFIFKAKIDGPCDFDVILKNKKVIIMEASARLSGSVGICSKAGVNFPASKKSNEVKLYPYEIKKRRYI